MFLATVIGRFLQLRQNVFIALLIEFFSTIKANFSLKVESNTNNTLYHKSDSTSCTSLNSKK